MNINCIICSDLFMPQSSVFATKCGHTFHYTCLIQWMERSKTCPQCRQKTTEKNIIRVFFNIVSTEGVEDAVSLQSKLDTANLQLRLKENHVKSTEEAMKVMSDENNMLKEQVQNIKQEVLKYKSGIGSLKEKLQYHEEKSKRLSQVEAELMQEKERLKTMEDINLALTGSKVEFTDIIARSKCPITLSNIAHSLKTELQAMEKKRNVALSTLKRTQKELNQSNKELNEYQLENEGLKSELIAHKQCNAEIEALRKKISELIHNSSNKVIDSNLARIVAESPAPMLTKPKLRLQQINENISFENVDSPSITDRIKQIKDSESPYLKIKSNNMSVFLDKRDGPKFGSSNSSIFKKSSSLSDLKQKRPIPEGCYNGLGGHSKEDKYPKPQPTGIKRTKSSLKLSNKFKKLKPITKTKLDDFLNMTND